MKVRTFAARLAGIATIAAAGAPAQPAPPAPPPGRSYDYRSQTAGGPRAATVRPGFTFAVTGDMIYGQPMLGRRDPEIAKVAALVRGADAALTNQEGSILDLPAFHGYLEAENGGGYPVGPPALARDIADLGFDFASKANNHASDFGRDGLLESRRHLQDAGVRTPGVGDNRFLARAPALFDTPRGRVAVVAAASTFTPASVAGGAEGVTGGRPGISALRLRRIVLAPEETMAGLRRLATAFGQTVAPDAREVEVVGQRYRLAPRAGVTYEMNAVDRFEILRAVRGAKTIADTAVFTIHAHENDGLGDDRRPADFQQQFYHDVIDAGGDIVAVHGPHLTRGIEIYRGRPIFYGLGHFVAHYIGNAPTTPEMAEDAGIDPRFLAQGDADDRRFAAGWFESILATVTYGAGGTIAEIRVYPLDLREDEPMPSRGFPRLATGAKAQAILRQVGRDSAVYGTRMTVDHGVGIIRPSPSRG